MSEDGATPAPTAPPPDDTSIKTHLRNVWFEDRLTYGRFAWLDAMTNPQSCDAPHFTFAWSVLVLATVVPLSWAETNDRLLRFAECESKNYTRCVAISPWGFDYGHWSLAWMCLWYFLRVLLIIKYRGVTLAHRRVGRPMPALAKAAWFAHVNGVPATIAAWLVYLVFSRDGEAHGPLTDASYAVNGVVAILDVLLFKMVLLYAHVVWILLVGMVYVGLMMWRSHHSAGEVVVGLASFIVVFMAMADLSMMRDTFDRRHVFVRF